MSKAWERTQLGLAGIGTGIMIAVLYLRHSTLSVDALDQLRDGAILLIGMLALSPISSRYHFILLLLPYTVLAAACLFLPWWRLQD